MMDGGLFGDLPVLDRPARPGTAAKVARSMPPIAGAFYGPPAPRMRIPQPFGCGGFYVIAPSMISRAAESDDASQCFIMLHGAREGILVGISIAEARRIAPWCGRSGKEG